MRAWGKGRVLLPVADVLSRTGVPALRFPVYDCAGLLVDVASAVCEPVAGDCLPDVE